MVGMGAHSWMNLSLFVSMSLNVSVVPSQARGVGDQAPESACIGRPGSVAPAALGPDLAPPLTVLTSSPSSPPSSEVGSSLQPPVVTTSSPGVAKSFVVTTAPFDPSLSRGSHRRSRPNRTRSIPSRADAYQALFGPASWAKYFDLLPLDSAPPHDFSLHRHLVDSVDACVTFNPTRLGTRVVAAPSQDAASRLAALSCLGEIPVRVSKNVQMNSSVGTILLPPHVATGVRNLQDCRDDIRHILDAQGHSVLQVDSFTRPPRGRRRQPLRVVKITFDGRTLPSSVILAGARCSVQEYIPSPRLCNKCWRFGHGALRCSGTVSLCPLCGSEGHSKSECTSPQARCLNCGEAHPTFSRACVHYKLEAAVLNLKHRERLSFPEARRQVRRLPPYTNISYARVLRSSSPRPSPLPQTLNRFRALDPDTPTAPSSVPLSSFPRGPPPGPLSGVPLLSTRSVMSPVSSSSSPSDPPSHPLPPSIGSPRRLSVQADVHRSPNGRRVCSRSASPVETLESVARYVVAGTPVSLSQKRKPGSSPSSSPAGKKASLSSLAPTSGSVAPSPPVSVVAPPVPAMEVSLAPASLSVAALAGVRSPLSTPPLPTAVLDCSSPLSPPLPPPPPDPARPPLICSPVSFPPSLLSLPMPPNPDFADPDPDPDIL
ncbi:uncharacterized protein [Procambarus clarkii]|uniref:uncharacterized protein n=1 Tax=Procambarus clarkii TaxID=6728 RepID=UPI0037446B1A